MLRHANINQWRDFLAPSLTFALQRDGNLVHHDPVKTTGTNLISCPLPITRSLLSRWLLLTLLSFVLSCRCKRLGRTVLTCRRRLLLTGSAASTPPPANGVGEGRRGGSCVGVGLVERGTRQIAACWEVSVVTRRAAGEFRDGGEEWRWRQWGRLDVNGTGVAEGRAATF